MTNQKTIKFSRVDSANFFRTLNKRVNSYFKENNVERTGNWKLFIKTAVMFSIFLAPYFLLLTLDLPGWSQLLLTIVMGIGMAGVGMNVMHDGNHGSFSKKKWVMYTTGRFNIMCCTTRIQIYTVTMKILKRVEYFVSQNIHRGTNTTVFSIIILFCYTVC